MSTTRRVARELALKTIFQVDVGKQPVGEVLDGALDQLRVTVTNPIARIARDTEPLLIAESVPAEEGVSAQSLRQLKGAAKAVAGELHGLSDRTILIIRDAIGESGHFESSRATSEFAAECSATSENIRLQTSRPSSYIAIMESLADAANHTIPRMAQAFEEMIPTALRAGEYVVFLVHGVLEKQEEIDRRVEELSSGWAQDRQAAVDRNILRLAAFELLYVEDVPVGAAINEAVDLAHKYSTEESGRFVNGVLGTLAAARIPISELAEPDSDNFDSVSEKSDLLQPPP